MYMIRCLHLAYEIITVIEELSSSKVVTKYSGSYTQSSRIVSKIANDRFVQVINDKSCGIYKCEQHLSA